MSTLDASLLTKLPPFERLTQVQIREILDQATPRRFDAGETVFSEGQPAERFYLLLDGVIRVVRTTPAGDQITLLHLPAGNLFGFAPAIGRETYPGTAECAAECLVLSWPTRLWPKFVAEYAGFAAQTARAIGDRMNEMQNKIAELATQAVESRVASAVLRMANQTGRRVADGIEIGFAVTRQDIAEMTGTTLHTVSRLLSAWERDGIVASSRRQITVLAPHRLVLLSGAGG